MVMVFDNQDESAKQSFTITVSNTNDPPSFTSSPVESAQVGVEYSYDTDATDVDPTDDNLTYSLLISPDGMEIDPITGVITWTPTADQVGDTGVVVQVSDGNDGTNKQTFSINIEPPEPVIEGDIIKKKGGEEMAVYGMVGFIIILVIIFVSLLSFLFRGGKKPPKQKAIVNQMVVRQKLRNNGI